MLLMKAKAERVLFVHSQGEKFLSTEQKSLVLGLCDKYLQKK